MELKSNNFQILFTFVLLLIFGEIMVLSSSMVRAESIYDNPFFFASRQAIFISIGFIIFCFFLLIPSDFLRKFDWLLLILSLILLVALFFPGVGTEVNGSMRWIRFGPINIQPSEVAKFCMLIYISGYCVRRLEEISSTSGFLRPLFVLTLFASLILIQPDYGSTAILCLIVMVLLFFAGISFYQFLILITLFLILGAIAIFLEPYRLIRLLSFIDPFEDIQDSGWQLAQSLISLGQGGWFGLGLGNSIQKNLFLPEAHTDFIFAILVEELGIIGGVCLILIYVFLLISIFKVSFESFNKIRPFQGYLCFGIGFLISLQVILNIGVNIGLLPTKGLTLPFISYGGTSLLVMMSLIAIVVRINNENKSVSYTHLTLPTILLV